MFKPATKEVGFVKAGIYGPKGTGKTTLLAMLLIYLSKTYHNSAPVAWLASEKGVDFVEDMFAIEKVPLLLLRSRSFVDLRNSAEGAIKDGACGLGADSVSHYWQELFNASMKAGGPRLACIGRAKQEWGPFAQDYQDSHIHYLVTGRMGYDWEDAEVEDAQGNIVKEIFKNGTKMKAEGDFGHEPDLEIQMSQIDDPDFVRYEKVRGRQRKTFKSQMLHVATVKKCRVWSLNGQAFTWKDQVAYKPGYYLKVAEPFKPYFDSINIGGSHQVEDTSRPKSEVLFQRGSEQGVYQDNIARKGILEELDNLLTQCFPAGEGRTNLSKMHRNLTLEFLNGYSSWSRMEAELATGKIGHHVEFLRKLRTRMDAGEKVTDQASLAALLHLADEDVKNPDHGVTLLELMGKQSIAAVKANGHGRRGPQPVVAIMDRQAGDELNAS
jgi:hypothetical protein